MLVHVFQKTLPKGYEYHLCHFKDVEGGYKAELRVAVSTESEAREWVKNYEMECKITLCLSKTYPNSGRINLFKIAYRCQHNTLTRSETADKRRGSKNTNCSAQMRVTVKRFVGEKSK